MYRPTSLLCCRGVIPFEVWGGQSVSEVFAGVHGAGPLEGVVKDFLFDGHKIHSLFWSKVA